MLRTKNGTNYPWKEIHNRHIDREQIWKVLGENTNRKEKDNQ